MALYTRQENFQDGVPADGGVVRRELDVLGNSINNITSAQITDGTIVNADISSSAAIDLSKLEAGGWINTNESWSYSSASGATGVITIPSDGTTKYSVGMRIRLVQTTTKYFLVTAISATSLTVWGGTDYTLANATITSPYYSIYKAPLGFPLNPLKWYVETVDTTQRSQASPVNGTWYNLGSVSINVPIGAWWIYYNVLVYTNRASGTLNAYTTLSTANNTESNTAMTTGFEFGSAMTAGGTMLSKNEYLNLAAAATYYLNSKVLYTGATNLYNFNDVSKLCLRIVSAYL